MNCDDISDEISQSSGQIRNIIELLIANDFGHITHAVAIYLEELIQESICACDDKEYLAVLLYKVRRVMQQTRAIAIITGTLVIVGFE